MIEYPISFPTSFHGDGISLNSSDLFIYLKYLLYSRVVPITAVGTNWQYDKYDKNLGIFYNFCSICD